MEETRCGDILPEKGKVVVFTALFGNEDRLWSVHPSFGEQTTFVAFTERPRKEVGLWSGSNIKRGTANVPSPNPIWQQRIVEQRYDDRRSARYYKTLVPELFDEYEYSIWIDANIRLVVPPLQTLERWLRQADIAVIEHPTRICLYDEARACVQLRKGHKAKITAQVLLYRNEGMPPKWGLPSTRCVIRRHNDRVAQLNVAWWEEIEKHSVRDQISLPYVAWKLGIRWNTIPGLHSGMFWFIKHGALPR